MYPLMLLYLLSSCSHGADDQLFPSDVLLHADSVLSSKHSYLGLTDELTSYLMSDSITPQESAAMRFVYAYMPTPDMLDHPHDYHLANIRTSLHARSELPWGKQVPAELFRHFVLPLRVNNEHLDDFRTQYYEELRDLVKGMSMQEAVLELNHWSHQHITYAPSDGRTSSPIATLRNALGRCGEQSTMVVAVLRTVGIPARQVYTPRWAHTDDNHAWVEAWVDGKWHYLGASEPAPVLDNAWFDAPVLRAMVLQTNAFGYYSGAEEKLLESPTYTVLNITSNYVPTAKATVRVLNPDGSPAEGASVYFRLYNYAELYPITTRTTDSNGLASMEAGLGDLMVTASMSDQLMAIGKLSNRSEGNTMELTLAPYDSIPAEAHYLITPPIARQPEIKFSEEEEKTNTQRMEQNNAIRAAYTATFPSETQAETLADQLTLSEANRAKLIDLFPNSRGYYQVIAEYLTYAETINKANEAVQLLDDLTEKDLHDIDPEVLRQSLHRDLSANEWQDWRITSPRVVYETLYPDQDILDQTISKISDQHPKWADLSQADRARIIAQSIEGYRLDKRFNPYRIALSPRVTLTHQMGDTESLTVLLVRLLRTAHIPAYYDWGNGTIVIGTEGGAEQILPFNPSPHHKSESAQEYVSRGCPVQLSFVADKYIKVPRYSTHYSINFVRADGQIDLYGYDWGAAPDDLQGKQMIHDKNFISTGTRQANGAVHYRMAKMICGIVTPIVFDRDTSSPAVIGSLNAELPYYDLATESDTQIITTTGRGYYILIIGRPHHEPTDHVLRDLEILKEETGTMPLPLIVLTARDDKPTTELMELRPDATWGTDIKGSIEQNIAYGLELTGAFDYPIIVVADTFNRIVFFSQGYTIGVGDQLKQTITQLR